MTYKELQKNGVKVYEKDQYPYGYYTGTDEYWVYNKCLYIHEYHENMLSYTGKTRTYQETEDMARFLIEEFIPECLGEPEVAEKIRELTDYF